ncbi:MAG: amidohydrolase family protein, partial [Pseudomonadota bacterium]|nr:amidohydrolase family protein [Pseudomonadota bacterium]
MAHGTSTRLLFAHALLPGGWARDVAIDVNEGGWIISVETGVRMASRDGTVALPGLPNLHSHAFQRGMAGLAEVRASSDDSFWTWRNVMYRFLDRLGPVEVEAIAALAYLEMLEAGFTAVGEFHYLHHAPDGNPYGNLAEMAARIAAAAATTGIGLTLLPCFYSSGGFGGQAPDPGQRRFINDLDGFLN